MLTVPVSDDQHQMSVGLIALLDDVAAIAKVAAASIDDVAAQAAKAGAKAAGVVIDDAAVTPRYVIGFTAQREIPIVRRIAVGSLKNKLLILLPLCLLLSYALPGAITPLLMIGGAYLCYEGAEKVFERLMPHHAHAHEAKLETVALNPQTLEDEKVAGAIKTDFILSAEIMAIALASVPDTGLLNQAIILALVGIAITVGVYGAVALIVKADDVGVGLAANPRRTMTGRLTRAVGRGLVLGMPAFLSALGTIGTAAMIWVGGSIIVHGLVEFGLHGPEEIIHSAAVAAGRALPAIAGLVEWLVTAVGSGLVGLIIGAALIPVIGQVVAPVWTMVRGVLRKA
jgi:predicted DNA repair protein MutK